ncbi:unnamed protein product [Rhizophagus irregularis]|nr:unnamed protein product [Rhizophagus irregularis]
MVMLEKLLGVNIRHCENINDTSSTVQTTNPYSFFNGNTSTNTLPLAQFQWMINAAIQLIRERHLCLPLSHTTSVATYPLHSPLFSPAPPSPPPYLPPLSFVMDMIYYRLIRIVKFGQTD